MTELVLTPRQARRMAVARQGLAGGRPDAASPDAMLELIRGLGCLQLDPISAVARSHLLVVWSRAGAFDPTLLEKLLWQERRLFEYWAHSASIVLTEDFPLFRPTMRHYATGAPGWPAKMREWARQNDGLRRHIDRELKRNGPLPARAFLDRADRDWHSGGWNEGRNVGRMLDWMWAAGRIAVAGRSGQQRLWDLAARWFPEWTPRERLSEQAIVRRAAQRSLRALGVATPKQIQEHFTRGRYPKLHTVLARLEREGLVARATIDGTDGDRWYVHLEDVPLLNSIRTGEWRPRTTLLSPFDNLICDRARTEQLFGFEYRTEIYTPKARRRFGYYVMPILHGDRLIGRLDPLMHRERDRLVVNAIHAEPDAPLNITTGRAIATAIRDLARFLGARDIEVGRGAPAAWCRALAS